jgi:hypothetical protein
MAIARSKKKAKSSSKAKSKKPALKKKIVAKAKPAKKVVKAKKPAPAPKKKPVAKKVAAKPAPKKVAAPAKKVAAPAKKPAPAPKKPAAKVIPIPVKKVPVQVPMFPEVDRALAQAAVEGLISRLPPPVQPVVNTLRRLVLEAAPEAQEQLDDGAPAYFANGVFARIEPTERVVLVRFLKGEQLPSSGELQGDSLSLSAIDELKESVLRKLVREAVMLNMSS